MYNFIWTDQAVDPINKAPVSVPVGTLNTTATSVALTGKGSANYGQVQQQNILHILENFASAAAPAHPTIGQLWFDSQSLTLRVFAQASPPVWKAVGVVQVRNIGDGPPSPAAIGDQWFEQIGPNSGYLYIYTGLGRYPGTPTTLGGWEQIYPSPEVHGGRDEYDQIRQLMSAIAGNSVSAFGSGAIGRAIANLTDFAALDKDLRTKYTTNLDTNLLYSPNTGISIDRDITPQAESTLLFYFNDSSTSGDGFIGGTTAGVPDPNVAGSIYIHNVATSIPAGILRHSKQVDEAFVMYDQPNTLSVGQGPYFVVQKTSEGIWQYDNDTTWVNFTPTTSQYIIGTISTLQDDLSASTYPVDKSATLWAHAVPFLGTKAEHLRVEPNSNDWDELLAAAKYALNRLELPTNYTSFISDRPFVWDGRPVPATLKNLNSSTDVRYPSAARRSNRKSSTIGTMQSFSETVNALKTAIANRFALKGINGNTGTNTQFAATTTIAVHAAPPAAGLSKVAGQTGGLRISFRFQSMDEMNRFLGSGGNLQVEMTHTGGASVGDTQLRTLLTTVGVWRIAADKVRIFGQATPLTITKPTVTMGIWNGGPSGTLLTSQTISNATLSMTIYRVSNTKFDLLINYNAGGAVAGTTAVTIKTISDNEMFGTIAPANVYPKPLAFATSDVVTAL